MDTSPSWRHYLAAGVALLPHYEEHQHIIFGLILLPLPHNASTLTRAAFKAIYQIDKVV